MTFHLKDILYIGGIIFSVGISYATIRSNKNRINKMEKNIDYLMKKLINNKK